METAATSKSLNYNANQTTISGNNTIATNTDTGTGKGVNTFKQDVTKTETLDLSSEVEQKETKGFFESIGDGLKAAGEAVAGGATWAINGIKEVGKDLAETAATVAETVESVTAKAWDLIESNPVTDTIADVYSTGAVVANSVVSGVAKLGEYANDGMEWVGGKVVEGGSWIAGQVAGLFSKDAKENIDNWRQDFSKDIKEDIARDKVGEINKMFYEGTELGRRINAHSAIKYDSEVAKKIQGVTTTVAEIAAATALTVATGGAAAPLAFGIVFGTGALVGAGKAAESTYQTHGTDTTFLQELGIAGSGALTGLTWVANGKLGQGALEIGKDIVAKGGATVLKDMGAQMLNKEFILSRLKDGLSFKNAAGKINLNAIMNYGQAAMGTAGSLTPYITGEEKFDTTAALKLGGTYLQYLGLNLLEDTARDYVSSYKATGAAAKVLTEAERAELEAIPDPTSASSSSSMETNIDTTPQTREKIKYTDIEKIGPFDEQLDSLEPGTYVALEGTRIPEEAVIRESWELYQYGDSYPEAIKKIEEIYGPNSIQATTARSVVIKEVINDLEYGLGDVKFDPDDYSSESERIVKKAQILFDQAGIPSSDYDVGGTQGSAKIKDFEDDISFWKSLTDKEKAPMLGYTGADYFEIGKSLRTGTELDEKLAENVRVLSSQLESRPGLSERTLLYRGYDNLDFIDESFSGMSKKELAEALNKLADGTKVIGDDSFCSSSISFLRAKGFGEVTEICSVAKGTKGAYLGSQSTNGFEKEYLLQAGTANRKIILGAEYKRSLSGIGDLIIYTFIP